MVRFTELSAARRGARRKLAAANQGATRTSILATVIGIDPEDGSRLLVSVDPADPDLSVLAGPTKVVPGALVHVEVDSAGRPIRVLGPASTRPEGLDEGVPAPPPVTPMEVLAPDELTEEERDLIYGSAERIEQVATETGEALSDLTTDLANLADGTSKTVFREGPPGTGNPGRVEGDQWIELDADGNGVAGWRWTGSAWVEYQLTDAMFDDVGINKLAVKDGHFDSAIIEQLGVDGLDARMIRTSTLHVAAGNLIPNGNGEIAHSTYPANWEYVPGDVPPGTGAVGSWKTVGAGNRIHGSNEVRVRVDPSEDHLLTFWVKQSEQGQFRFALATHNDDYQQVDYYYRGPTFNNWGTWGKYTLDIPKEWLTGKYLELHIRNSTSTTLTTAGWDLRPKVGGRIILDGAFDAKTITGGFFYTSSDSANSVRMTPDGISAFVDGVEQVRLSQNIEGGLAVRSPFSGAMVSLSRMAFGNVVFAPTRNWECPAASNDFTTDYFGEVVGRFTATTTRYMVMTGADIPVTTVDEGFKIQALGAEFTKVADPSWKTATVVSSYRSFQAGSLSTISTIHLGAGIEYDVSLIFRAMKNSGIVGGPTIRGRSILIMPIH